VDARNGSRGARREDGGRWLGFVRFLLLMGLAGWPTYSLSVQDMSGTSLGTGVTEGDWRVGQGTSLGESNLTDLTHV
jgi:hypothetical protein